MLPNFLGLGAPKSATTWLFQCLRDHPDVFIPGSKEVNYFAERFESMSQEDYEQYFEDVTDESAVGEITTLYLGSEEAPRRARDTIPDAKLFVSLRNPMDQVYSHYWHLLRQKFHPKRRPRPESFEEALDMYPDMLLRPARYHENLSRWLEHYDRSQLHVILHGDLAEEPGQALRQLFEFLDVDSSVRPSLIDDRGRSSRRGTSPRGQIWERMYVALYDFLGDHVYMPLMNLIGHDRAERVKNTLRIREIMETLFREKGYPEMDPETRKTLRDYFADDIQELEDLTGRDLSHWR